MIFWYHDEIGARWSPDIAARLRFSRRFEQFLGHLVRQHLRLGFLVRELPLTRRALARFRRAVEPFVFEAIVLSLCDRMATRGEQTSPRRSRVTSALRATCGRRPRRRRRSC